jgi:hypothetical protein
MLGRREPVELGQLDRLFRAPGPERFICPWKFPPPAAGIDPAAGGGMVPVNRQKENESSDKCGKGGHLRSRTRCHPGRMRIDGNLAAQRAGQPSRGQFPGIADDGIPVTIFFSLTVGPAPPLTRSRQDRHSRCCGHSAVSLFGTGCSCQGKYSPRGRDCIGDSGSLLYPAY